MAWNEMRFDKQLAIATSSPSKRANRFESAETLRCIYMKLENILKFLVKFDHSNMINFHDYWFVENEQQAKLVVITDYSTGGSLRRLLDAAMTSKSAGAGHSRGRVKIQTGRRWLNQALYLLRCLHNEGISLFQGAFSTETMFIQSCGVIKLAPALLALNGLCVFENGVIKCNATGNGPRIQLNDEFRVYLDPFFLILFFLTNFIKKIFLVKTKDMQALGRLAIQIFTAHVKSSNSPGGNRNRIEMMPNVEEYLTTNLPLIDDPLQKDFIHCCFDAKTIEVIWLHPLLNYTYSLKVLSVYSIFAYFQEKRQQQEICRNNSQSSLSSSNTTIGTPTLKQRKSSSKLAFGGAHTDSSTG